MKMSSLRKGFNTLEMKIRHHKFGLGAFFVAFVSFFLVIQTIFCLITPFCYPTSNLTDIVPIRTISPYDYDGSKLFSSVEFVNLPINSKQRIEVNLNSLSEITVDWTLEMYLLENITMNYETFRFVEYELVNNLELYYNGIRLEYGYVEQDGEKLYTLPPLEVVGDGRINQLEIHFDIDRTDGDTRLINTPLIFNENYATRLFVPMTVVPVQLGNFSDSNLLRVNFGVPFRRIIIEGSGWVDTYIPPESEWEKYWVTEKVYNFSAFEYPITQEYKQESNVYTFKTIFSEKNIARSIAIVIVPNYSIPAILVLFLLSPIFILLLTWINEKKIMDKPTVKKYLVVAFETYATLSGMSFVTSFFGGELNLSLLLCILEITNPLSLVFVVCSPAVFGLLYTLWRTRNKNIKCAHKKKTKLTKKNPARKKLNFISIDRVS